MQNSSQWCSRNVQLLRTTVNWCWWRFTHTFCHSSNILGCTHCLVFHALVYWWGCQFLSLFSQDSEHTELTVLLFFQNPRAIFAHVVQHYHDFQSNVAIFPSVVQAYRPPVKSDMSMRHVTSWKKNIRWRTQYKIILNVSVICYYRFSLMFSHSSFIYKIIILLCYE